VSFSTKVTAVEKLHKAKLTYTRFLFFRRNTQYHPMVQLRLIFC